MFFENCDGDAPCADSKDMWIILDNQYMYHIGTFQLYPLNLDDITTCGLDLREQIVLNITMSCLVTAGVFNFSGLIGFDLQ